MDLFAADFEPIPLPDAELAMLRNALGQDSRALLRTLIRETPWRSETIRMWGRPVRQPRLIAWYGDPGAAYAYSGIELAPPLWTATLLDIRRRICSAGIWTSTAAACGWRLNGRRTAGPGSSPCPATCWRNWRAPAPPLPSPCCKCPRIPRGPSTAISRRLASGKSTLTGYWFFTPSGRPTPPCSIPWVPAAKETQEIMRHATPILTMQRYVQAQLGRRQELVEGIANLVWSARGVPNRLAADDDDYTTLCI